MATMQEVKQSLRASIVYYTNESIDCRKVRDYKHAEINAAIARKCSEFLLEWFGEELEYDEATRERLENLIQEFLK